jgi:hypothetical protein
MRRKATFSGPKQRRAIDLSLIDQDVAVGVRGHGKVALPDELSDPGPNLAEATGAGDHEAAEPPPGRG